MYIAKAGMGAGHMRCFTIYTTDEFGGRQAVTGAVGANQLISIGPLDTQGPEKRQLNPRNGVP